MDEVTPLKDRRRNHLSIRPAELFSRTAVLSGVIVLVVGVILTMAVFSAVRAQTQQAERVRFERHAAQLTQALQSSFDVPLQVLHGVSSLFDASGNVSRSEFAAFVRRSLLRWPEIYAIEWFPRVGQEQRAQFEALARADGLPGFEFTEVGSNDQMVRAKPRPEHLPLFYMEPPNRLALGFDLASEDSRVTPVWKARDTGSFVISSRIRLVEDPPSVVSIAAFCAVYSGGELPSIAEERRERFAGTAAIVFRVAPVVERAVRDLDLADMRFVVSDGTAPPESRVLYESKDGLSGPAAKKGEEYRQAERAILLGDHSWALTLFVNPPTLGGGLVLGLGLSTTVLLAVLTAFGATLGRLRGKMHRAMRLGQYTLIEKIGEGAMGVVYKARHALLSRPTAIKLLTDEGDESRALRFEREAELTSQLSHPNTIVVYDYGRTAAGELYYVMEYIEGVTLEELVRAFGPLPPARVVHILLQVCGALREAHATRLIHRDIKPANLMLTRRGEIPDFVKVLDFGLVKWRGPEAVALSGVHKVLGTPAYLSPESILSPDRVDARSDIYALGAVAYYLLTGELVFTGESVLEVCGKHLHQEPVLPSLRSGLEIPPALEQVILRCLAKAPDARFQDAAALECALFALVPTLPWSRADAEGWWNDHPGKITSTRRGHILETDTESLVVDLEDRGRSLQTMPAALR